MNCSMQFLHFPVLHYLLEFLQAHVHWVNDDTQPSHPLSPPSPPALNLSQHQGLFQWVGQNIGTSVFLPHSIVLLLVDGFFPFLWERKVLWLQYWLKGEFLFSWEYYSLVTPGIQDHPMWRVQWPSLCISCLINAHRCSPAWIQVSFCALMNATLSVLDNVCENKTTVVSLKVTLKSL